MKYLNKEQTEIIRKEIQRRGVKHPVLEVNILDFICTAVEKELEKQPDFEQAMQATFNKLKPNELQITEQKTQELLNNYFSVLEKLIFTALALVVIGFILLFFGVPFADILLLVSVATFSIVYLYANAKWYIHLKSLKPKPKFMLSAVALLFFILFLATIFKLLHFPGAGIMLIGAIIPLMIIPVYFSFLFFFTRKDWYEYRFIDVFTKRAEIFLSGFLLLGAIARFLSISPMGSMLIFTSLLGFGVLYLSYTWKFYGDRNYEKYNLPLFLLSIVAYLFLLVISLFKVMGWPLFLPAGFNNLPFILLTTLALFWYGKSFLIQKNLQSASLFIGTLFLSFYTLLLFLQKSHHDAFISYIYNLPVLGAFVGLLVLFYRFELLRALAISLFAYYVLVFPPSQMPFNRGSQTVSQIGPEVTYFIRSGGYEDNGVRPHFTPPKAAKQRFLCNTSTFLKPTLFIKSN